uniref:Uncharacterized protein n=1 Tax=Chenopodium quinoa TaxID=63459 RepID=A0A803L8I3_CHEQI
MKAALKYLAGIAGPSGYGSNSTADQVTEHCFCPPHLLTAIITGATSGIGAETARVLAKKGVRIIIAARNLSKGAEVKEAILKEAPHAQIIILEIDLSSMASVSRFCSEFLSLDLPLNILINNAGVFSQKLEFSEDKIELTMATNYFDSLYFLAAKLLKTTSQGAATTCYVALCPETEGVSGKYFADCNQTCCSALAADHSQALRLWKHTRTLICRRLQHPSLS